MKLLIEEQQESFENAKTCYVCKEKSGNRGRCHYTGEYRGAGHRISNLKYCS